jgi:hypothetical protein
VNIPCFQAETLGIAANARENTHRFITADNLSIKRHFSELDCCFAA